MMSQTDGVVAVGVGGMVRFWIHLRDFLRDRI